MRSPEIDNYKINGLKMELGPILDWGLQMHKQHILVDASTMQTNLPGVYAVGDIATYPNKLKLILTGFSTYFHLFRIDRKSKFRNTIKQLIVELTFH